jgi:hypothetical protein
MPHGKVRTQFDFFRSCNLDLEMFDTNTTYLSNFHLHNPLNETTESTRTETSLMNMHRPSGRCPLGS